MTRAPAIYSAHHAGIEFGEFSDRVALGPEERYRMSDFGTAETVAHNGLVTLIAPYSRGIVDLNRASDDPGRFSLRTSKRPDAKAIWLPGQEPTADERDYMDVTVYQAYHDQILDALRAADTTTFVVAWDNAGYYQIGNDSAGQPVMMKPVILSNQGKENSPVPDGQDPTSCDPEFLLMLGEHLQQELGERDLPNEVCFNLVFRGGYISEFYNSRRHAGALRQNGVEVETQSFQVEYDGTMTTDEAGRQIPEKTHALRQSFEAAMTAACHELGFMAPGLPTKLPTDPRAI